MLSYFKRDTMDYDRRLKKLLLKFKKKIKDIIIRNTQNISAFIKQSLLHPKMAKKWCVRANRTKSVHVIFTIRKETPPQESCMV